MATSKTWGEWAGDWYLYWLKVYLWIFRLFTSVNGPSLTSGPTKAAAEGPPEPLRVIDAYRDRVILITGASGYLGSLVLEQLLRLCPDVAKVYIIVRPKQGRDAQQRLNKILQGILFRKLQPQLGEIEEKIHVIPGDLTAPNLGLSTPNRVRLASEVHYIIHCAADIRFTLTFAESLKANYHPTKELLALAKEAKRLKAFTYVSTAYVNSHLPKGETVQEVIMQDAISLAKKDSEWTDMDTQAKVMELLMKVDPAKALAQGTRLLKASGLANPYMLAKNFTERLVLAADKNPVPVCIVRPSGIGALAGEPCPGYIGNPSGMTAFILAGAAGGITQKDVSEYSFTSVCGMVPAECVSSTILAATIAAAEDRPNTPKIYQVCSSTSHPLRLAEAAVAVQTYFKEDPPSATAKTLLEGWSKARDEQLEWQDYNLCFDVSNTLALQKRLTGPKEAGLSCVWLPSGPVDWNRYFRTYAAGVKHTYLREKPKAGLPHQDYVP
eukprot:jgi/Botrbrau1/12442/Bobra.0094s0011.1